MVGLFKTLGVLLGIVVIVVLYEVRVEKSQERDRESVEITITFDTESCSEELPLLIKIINGRRRIVDKVSWTIGAYKKGHSTDVVGYESHYGEYYEYYSSDKILDLGQQYSACYKHPPLASKNYIPKELNWAIRRKSLDFR